MELTEYARMDAVEDHMWWYRALHRRLVAALAGLDGCVLDAGCGTGGLLARLLVERPDLRTVGLEWTESASRRAADKSGAPIVRGSVNRLPFAAACFDAAIAADLLCHGAVVPAQALAELLRVLRPGGRLIVVDNDYRWGEFAVLLAASAANPPPQTAARTDAWWAARGATRHEVRSELRFAAREDLASVLRIEFPAEVADGWLSRNPSATGLTYGYVLFAVTG